MPAPDMVMLGFWIDAWRELYSCRQIGSGLGPIPFTAIVEYAKVYEIEDFEEFLFMIRIMDNTYLNLREKKNDGRRNKNKTSSSKV